VAGNDLSIVFAVLAAARQQSPLGSARTALDDDQTDFYPVKLARDVLRPA